MLAALLYLNKRTGAQNSAMLPMRPANTKAETIPTALARPWSGLTSARAGASR